MVHPAVAAVDRAGRRRRQVRRRPEGRRLRQLRARADRPPRSVVGGLSQASRSAETLVTRLLLSCGEASGDLYAGALVEALRRREPDIDVAGLASDRFAAAGGRLIADFHGLSV